MRVASRGVLKSRFPRLHAKLSGVRARTIAEHNRTFYRIVARNVRPFFPKPEESSKSLVPLPARAQAKLEAVYRFIKRDAPAYPSYRFYRDHRNLLAFETSFSGRNIIFKLYRVRPNGMLEEKPYFDSFGADEGERIVVSEMGNRFLPGRHLPLPKGKRIPEKFRKHKGRGVLNALLDFVKFQGFREVVFDNVRNLAPFEELRNSFGTRFEVFETNETRYSWGLPRKGPFTHVRILIK